jgi:acetamidase/formamidase
MQRVGNEILYFETGPDNPVTHRVKSGETLEVQTQINAGPWIDRLSPEEQEPLRKRLAGGNPASGCIFVEGAKPGDMLSVEIGPIEVDPIGYTKFGGGTDATPRGLKCGPCEKLVEITKEGIRWTIGGTGVPPVAFVLPLRPMLGFVGVAPARERLHNGWAGVWGGNLDAQEVTTGATLHLRVQCPGALLHVGDMHAIQGDGEICGAGGIEAGGRVLLTCRVTSPAPKSLRFPRFENATHIGVFALARPAEDSFRIALAELLAWLEESYAVPQPEAIMLLAQVLEARATEFVNPLFTYVAKIHRQFLPAALT